MFISIFLCLCGVSKALCTVGNVAACFDNYNELFVRMWGCCQRIIKVDVNLGDVPVFVSPL